MAGRAHKSLHQQGRSTRRQLLGTYDSGTEPPVSHRCGWQARCIGSLQLRRKRMAFVTSHQFQQGQRTVPFATCCLRCRYFRPRAWRWHNCRRWAAGRPPKCALPVIKETFGSESVRARTRRIPSTVRNGLVWRITLLPASGAPRREFIDVQAFARGRAVVALSVTAFPGSVHPDLTAAWTSSHSPTPSVRAGAGSRDRWPPGSATSLRGSSASPAAGSTLVARTSPGMRTRTRSSYVRAADGTRAEARAGLAPPV